MNFIFQVIFLIILFVTNVETTPDLKESLEIAEYFHSNVIKKLVVKCREKEHSKVKIEQMFCRMIKKLEEKFQNIHPEKGELTNYEEVEKRIVELSDSISADFHVFKEIGIDQILTKRRINELQMGLVNLMHEWKKGNENGKLHGKVLEWLTMQVEHLKEHQKSINGNEQILKNAEAKKLAVDCILSLSQLLNLKNEGKHNLDLAMAFSVFGVELLVYSTKIPWIGAELFTHCPVIG